MFPQTFHADAFLLWPFWKLFQRVNWIDEEGETFSGCRKGVSGFAKKIRGTLEKCPFKGTPMRFIAGFESGRSDPGFDSRGGS